MLPARDRAGHGRSGVGPWTHPRRCAPYHGGMLDVRIGPLALSGPRFGALLALAALLIVAEVVDRRGRRGVAAVAWNAVLLGLLGARLGFVALHAGSYLPRLWTVLYVWQGGFAMLPGAAVGTAYAVAVLARRAPLLRGALLAGAVGAVVWGGWQAASITQAPPPASLSQAPLPSLTGDPVAPAAFLGAPVVLNLWATWCGPCQRELPLLASVARETPGVTFLFVSQGEPRERVATYLQDRGLQLEHVLLDPGSTLSAAASTAGLPTTLFFDASGTLRGRWLGELSRARLEAELARIR